MFLNRIQILLLMIATLASCSIALAEDGDEEKADAAKGQLACPDNTVLKQTFFKSGMIEDYCFDPDSKEKHGPYIHFKDSNKTVKIEEGNYQQGKIEGTNTLWYENGVIKAKGEMLDSARQGLWSFYNEEGVLLSTENYVLGQLEGKCIRYYENGQKKDEITYAGGKKLGTYTLWYDNGKIKTSGELVDSKQQGKWENWNKEGATTSYSTYKDGVLNGASVTFWPDGKEKVRANYVNNKYDGEYLEYYESGEKKEEGNYSSGNKVGRWQYWDENGKPENSKQMVKEINQLYRKKKYIEADSAIRSCLNKFPDDRYCSKYSGKVENYVGKLLIHHIKDAGIYEEGDGYMTWFTAVNEKGKPVKAIGTLTLYLELEREKKLVESHRLETVEVTTEDFDTQNVGEYGKQRKLLVFKHFIRFDKKFERFRKLDYREELYLRFEFVDYRGNVHGERDEFHME